MQTKWWMKANIYQVYLRSFFDANNDGIGDILGVINKLEYLKELGVNAIWISPHYDSPMDDNGYDVRDFMQVSQDYGTIDDFKRLIKEAHKHGIRVITDLVLNHTSDEHLWFQKAKNPEDPDFKKYHDYYIWQPPKYNESGERIRPTRWIGWFGNPAWTYNEATNEYYLNIFSKKMPDLNWRNKDMREDIKKVIKYWIDLGVDGFRIDASNHLEKNWDFPDAYPGYENFSSLPKHHEYLQELGKELFVPYDILALGESGGAKKEEALKYVGYGSNEFNLLIQFGHCWVDIIPGHKTLPGKWSSGPLHPSYIKQSFKHWYDMLGDLGWNLIYWHNHDQPRVVSHYGNDTVYHNLSAKMLAIALYFMPGTSIVYQGEEIGMSNLKFDKLEDFRDVEVFTEYENMKSRGISHDEAMQILRDRSRDNARSPMQWSDDKNAGFSKTTPWMQVNFNFNEINVKNQDKDPNSILNTYRFIINLRNQDFENIASGDIEFIELDSDPVFSYINKGKTKDYLVICNFTNTDIQVNLEDLNTDGFTYFYSNSLEKPLNKQMQLLPYEAYVYVRTK